MTSRPYQLVRMGVVCAAVLILLLGATAARLTYAFLDANRWVRHTTEVIAEVRATRTILGIALSSGSPGPAARNRAAELREQLQRVAELTRDNPRQQKNIDEFRSAISGPAGDPDGAQSLFAAGAVEALNPLLDRMQREEYGLLLQRSATQADAMQQAGRSIFALCAGLMALGVFTSLTARKEFLRRAGAEATLQKEKEELKRYSDQLALVSTGSELIQAVRDEDQLTRTVARVLSDLFPGCSGYFGLLDSAQQNVHVRQSWGELSGHRDFVPSKCLALQLGKPVNGACGEIPCACGHVSEPGENRICVPVRSANGHLGVIHVQTKCDQRALEALGLLAAHVALALTNLRVREALQQQSVRDPLTGLFNRRYFDETLQRELASARRDHSPVSVLMLDLDHFKRINDTLGHAAGDQVLREFAQLVQSTFRESDIPCRYGGEEFAVILVGASAGDAYARAESFRQIVASGNLGGDSVNFGSLTTSIGLASSMEFPDQPALLSAADSALYHAKSGGRNRTSICSSEDCAAPASAFCTVPLCSQS